MTSSPSSKKKSQRSDLHTIVVFAKEPIAGKVKTRLQKSCPATTVLALYQAFVLDTLTLVARIPCAEKWIFYESWGRPPRFLRKHGIGVRLFPQRGQNLGSRLNAACQKLRPSPEHPVVIIGADTPHLSRERISSAFRCLRTHDVVLGPAKDGGFYLLGLKNSSREIFAGVSWSTDKVLRQIVRNFEKQNLSYCFLPTEFDLDQPSDLRRLFRTTDPLPANLSRVVRQNPYLKEKFES
jgi:uncharacterized protein